MTTTINLKLPEIAESQASKAITHNEALHVIDALLNCGVIDRDLTAPPGSPVDGDVYIPKATATGAWAGKENKLAHYDVNAWKFYPPEEGWRCYVRDEDSLLVYTGSAWTVLAGGAGPLPDFTEAKNTTSPNATVPVVSLTATSSETDVDVAIKPKGAGALTRWIADGTTAGGNKRGANATDWGVMGSNAAWVASGDYSTIGGGQHNQAVGTHTTVAGGYNNLASSGFYASIGGGASNVAAGYHAVISGGNANSASAQYSSVGGGNSNQATNNGARVGGGNSNTATAQNSTVGGGNTNTATATHAVVGGGTSNTASGTESTVGGGEGNTASGVASCVPGGKEATTRGIRGMLAYGSGKIGTLGDAQCGKYCIRAATSGATPTVLTSDGNAAGTVNGVILPNNSTYTFKGLVSARGTASGDSSGWEFTGVIKRGANAAATALVAAVTPTLIAQDAGAATWVLAVTADTTNGGLSVTVTGVAATTIRWVANINTVEVTN